MKKILYMAGVALATMAIFACDEDTQTIGNSLTDDGDKLQVTDSTFEVTTCTYVADSVLSQASTFYLGRVRDPETGSDVTSEFSTQFHSLESTYVSAEEYIVGRDADDGRATADSCDIIIYLSEPYKGDSLASLKMMVRELETPIESSQNFYSNYDPMAFVRKASDGGINQGQVFTFQNRTDTDSARNSSTYLDNIRISLNQPYTGKDGKVYKNYGTYILRQYLDHPEYFRNAYLFTHKVCPGFFFEITDGLGFYSQVTNIGLRTYYNVALPDTAYRASLNVAGTKEVLQTVRITNDREAIEQMALETGHTYLKSPAGLFTEVSIPVEQIRKGHERDSILGANIVFQRLNDNTSDTRTLGIPSTILMLQKDSLKSYFENKSLPDSHTSYITSFTSGTNTYTFSNISNIIQQMWQKSRQALTDSLQLQREPTEAEWSAWKEKHPNWNKVLLVPVSYNVSSSTSTITKVQHSMALSSTRLVGGQDNPIKLKIVYAKFKE